VKIPKRWRGESARLPQSLKEMAVFRRFFHLARSLQTLLA
jgi:hypothetical protein